MTIPTAIALALKSVALALGIVMLVRAVGRRVVRRADGRETDPAVTRGLLVLASVAAVIAAGMGLVLLRLQLGWPAWVGTLGFGVVGGGGIGFLSLAAWLGWRTAGEELGIVPRPKARPPESHDGVT